jgi:exosome complex RNA-binding protein Rrp42 (RNase PH superfamily)
MQLTRDIFTYVSTLRRFNVELSPMASASFAAGKPGEGAVELARLVERCVRGSGALDLEALCVLPGRKVGLGAAV